MTACEYSTKEDTIYLGLSSGKIYYYKSKNIDQSKTVFAKGKDPEHLVLESATPHIGAIRKMICAEISSSEGKLEFDKL